MLNVAMPLFSLVDGRKIDLTSRQLPELAEQLGAFLAVKHQIEALDWRIEVLAGDPYLIANALAEKSLPSLFALAEVQRSTLYRYLRESEEQARLVPIALDPEQLGTE
jgi:hypothetical protein